MSFSIGPANAPLSTDSGKPGPSEQLLLVSSDLFDISAADSEQVVFTNNYGKVVRILKAWILWNEATGASGAAEGDVTVGTATGGAQIVVADAYDVSQATGSVQALTLVAASEFLAADAEVFVSHDQAAGAAGTYFFQMLVAVPEA